MMKKMPSLAPRDPLNPLHWLASYIMRKNPKYITTASLSAASSSSRILSSLSEVSSVTQAYKQSMERAMDKAL